MQYGFTDVLQLLGALGVFLFGMKVMSDALLKLAGNKIEMVDQAARVALGLPELRSFSGSRR